MQRNRPMMKNLILAISLLTAGNVYAQDTARKINPFSLAQALDYAKQNAVEVKNALVDILIQKQVNREVTSIALPQISGSAGMTHNFNIAIQTLPNFISQGTYNVLVENNVADGNGNAIQPLADYGTIPFPLGNPWNASAGLTLSQMIFDGQVFIALKARDGTMDLQQQIAGLTEENIRVNVAKVYYQLVVGKITMQLIDENINRLRKLHRDVTVMYDNGFAEKLDINKLSVQLANLETEKLRADNQIKNGYSGLKVLMGMPVKDSLILTDTLNEEKISEGVLEASQFSYSDRKEFKIALLTNDLNKLNIRRYKLSQLPTLSLVGGYSKQAQRDQFDIFVKGDWFTSSYAGLQLRVPIFHGFSYRARTEKARLELRKSENQAEALKISIDDEIDNAKNNFATSIVSMNYQKKNMLLAEEVYDQTKKKYELGVASTTDINNTQTDLKTAQTNYLSATYNAIIAKIDFLKATGKL